MDEVLPTWPADLPLDPGDQLLLVEAFGRADPLRIVDWPLVLRLEGDEAEWAIDEAVRSVLEVHREHAVDELGYLALGIDCAEDLLRRLGGAPRAETWTEIGRTLAEVDPELFDAVTLRERLARMNARAEVLREALLYQHGWVKVVAPSGATCDALLLLDALGGSRTALFATYDRREVPVDALTASDRLGDDLVDPDTGRVLAERGMVATPEIRAEAAGVGRATLEILDVDTLDVGGDLARAMGNVPYRQPGYDAWIDVVGQILGRPATRDDPLRDIVHAFLRSLPVDAPPETWLRRDPRFGPLVAGRRSVLTALAAAILAPGLP